MHVLFIILFIFILLLALIVQTAKMKEIEQENYFLESYMNTLQGFYGAIKTKIEITRKYRHDVARHIQTLEMLLERKSDNTELEEHVKDLKEIYRNLSTDKFCEDEIINTILIMTQQKCREKDICLEVKMDVMSYDKILGIDMVGLLHNVLDNAVEACEHIAKDSDRKIHFLMEKTDGKLHILVKNSITEGGKVTFETNKDAKEEHGIGMMIIKDFVDKYDGIVTTYIKENIFNIQIII